MKGAGDRHCIAVPGLPCDYSPRHTKGRTKGSYPGCLVVGKGPCGKSKGPGAASQRTFDSERPWCGAGGEGRAEGASEWEVVHELHVEQRRGGRIRQDDARQLRPVVRDALEADLLRGDGDVHVRRDAPLRSEVVNEHDLELEPGEPRLEGLVLHLRAREVGVGPVEKGENCRLDQSPQHLPPHLPTRIQRVADAGRELVPGRVDRGQHGRGAGELIQEPCLFQSIHILVRFECDKGQDDLLDRILGRGRRGRHCTYHIHRRKTEQGDHSPQFMPPGTAIPCRGSPCQP